ncbi:Sphingosine-1-phosphate phosphatase 1 [Halotydeus destructor]|nr:Sphingosine-1-phosphate phosphatase 1 [Halotydeus destructor]
MKKTSVKMCSMFEKSFSYLQSPELVASFQQFFGVESLVKEQAHRRKQETAAKPQDGRTVRKKSTANSSDAEKSSTAVGSSEETNYVIKNQFWYYLFSFGASLGYETFYASFFPIWFWNIDSAVGRRMILVWVTVMYIGQALKDVIRWPRPESPPVVSLEPEYAVEYGMPSTHAVVGMALPFSMLIFTVHRYEYSFWYGLVLACAWCSLVCGSRLYLGMHSALDIIAGLILAAFLMLILVPLIDVVDYYYLRSAYTPFITIAVVVAMAKFYPKSDRWSPARGDTCVIMGAGAGILLGSWLNYQLGIYTGPGLAPPFPIIWPGINLVGLAFLRAIIGIICILAARGLGKMVVLSIVCYIRELDPTDPKTRVTASVEVPYKLITYLGMGLTITFVSPFIFRLLNIERVTMFTEV